jgi:hypothetical protein
MTDIVIHEPLQELIAEGKQAQAAFRRAWAAATVALDDGMMVELSVEPKKDTRSARASAAMWAHLGDIARQVEWYGRKLSKKTWKEILSASLRAQEVVPGIDGGFVVLGVSTSRMSVAEMCAMIDVTVAFGNERAVKWTAPKWIEEDAARARDKPGAVERCGL